MPRSGGRGCIASPDCLSDGGVGITLGPPSDGTREVRLGTDVFDSGVTVMLHYANVNHRSTRRKQP